MKNQCQHPRQQTLMYQFTIPAYNSCQCKSYDYEIYYVASLNNGLILLSETVPSFRPWALFIKKTVPLSQY